MSDPIDPFEREQRREANPVQPADPIQPSWLTNPYADDRYLMPEEPAPIVPQERLFSRRVLFGWAFATLVVVFAVTVILPMLAPIVKQTVVTNVEARMKERGMNIRVNGQPVEPVMPVIPKIPPIPAAPAVPAIAGEPAPAATSATPASPHHTKTPAPATSDRH